MEFFEVLNQRRSVRKFLPQSVSDELIKKIIAAATLAPSACNFQLWQFIVIRSQVIKDKIVAAGGAITIKDAPVGILVTYNNQTANLEYRDYIQSAAAAIENMLLAAQTLGLGTCWVCHLPTKKFLRKLLEIPASYDPIAYILLGYPAYQPTAVSRKYSIEQVLSFEQFNPRHAQRLGRAAFLKRILTYTYRRLPNFIKKSFLNKFIDKHFVKKFEN